VYTAVNSGLAIDEVRGGAPVQRAIASLLPEPAAVPEGRAVLKGFRRLFAGTERRA